MHSIENYTLGRGILSIAKWANGAPGSYQDIGNCSKLELAIKVDKLEHYSSRSGLRVKDKVVTVEAGYSGTFELDEIAADQLALYVMGTVEGTTIHGLQSVDQVYALRFMEDNASGPNYQWDFWCCLVQPTGNFGLITEKAWASLQYSFEGMADTVNHPESNYFDVALATTTTTTTTT